MIDGCAGPVVRVEDERGIIEPVVEVGDDMGIGAWAEVREGAALRPVEDQAASALEKMTVRFVEAEVDDPPDLKSR